MKTTERLKDEKLEAIINELKAAYKLREINEFGHDTIPWTPLLDAALAMPTEEEENKPYLPLPAPDLVVLGHGNTFNPNFYFEGWALDLKDIHPQWRHGSWIGNNPDSIYAAHRDSEVARLNWEAILNRELEELGKDPAPKLPEGFDRWVYRGKGWSSDRAMYVCSGNRDWSLPSETAANGYEGYDYLEAVKDEREEDVHVFDSKKERADLMEMYGKPPFTEPDDPFEELAKVFDEARNTPEYFHERIEILEGELKSIRESIITERQRMVMDFLSRNYAYFHSIGQTHELDKESLYWVDRILGRKDGE